MPADQFIIEAAKGAEIETTPEQVRDALTAPMEIVRQAARAILFAAEVLEREAAKDAEIARLTAELERIRHARPAFEGGSIAECRRIADQALGGADHG